MMNFLTQEQWIALPPGQEFAFDIECFRNFFFIGFQNIKTDDYVVFTADDNNALQADALRWFVHRHLIVGFNSIEYDMPILTFALTGASTAEIRKVNDMIIQDKIKSFDYYKKFQLEKLDKVNHIDVMRVCPLDGGLKLYGGRLHSPKVQECPAPIQNFLTESEKIQVGNYCLNDLAVTKQIYQNLQEQIALRVLMTEQYGVDLRSSSDAQIAEKVITAEIKKITGSRPNKPHIAPGFEFQYQPPAWVCFQTPVLQSLFREVCEARYVVDANGYPELPKTLEGRAVTIGTSIYRLGNGGLHSSEESQAILTTDPEDPNEVTSLLVDIDVASYYPAIIRNNKFSPLHLGETFMTPYETLIDRRLEAKKIKHSDADSLKIVINGLFGKFGSKHSTVYSPQLLIQVTMTGQLALLMLIEYAEMSGIKAVSANTDGVVFHVNRDGEQLEQLKLIVSQWGAHTGFETEETYYKALYSRDVNNYIAIKEIDGKAKTKGKYLLPEGIFRFHKNPDCNIVSRAVVEYLKDGTPLEKTIGVCQDIREFLIVRTVKGGGEWTGEYLGKVVRWYYSRHSKDPITYKGSGKKVARSDNAMPLMELPEKFPKDVDFAKYVDLAEKELILLGAKKAEVPLEKELQLFTAEELAILAKL